jgi:PAS domain S-box-containing protein
MLLQYNPYMIPLAVGATVSAACAFYAWRQRHVSGVIGAMTSALLLLAVAEWSLCYTLEIGSADLATKFFWAKMKYFGVVAVPVAWLCFAAQYTGRGDRLTRRNLTLLTIEPIITLSLIWTNDFHGLIWNKISLDASGAFLYRATTHGAWFWFNTIYSYLLVLFGGILLFQRLIYTRHLYRKQVFVILVSVLTPWIGNVLYVTGLNPFPFLDLTPFGVTITGLAVTLGLLRFHLFDILPVAQGALIESMTDIVIVIDAQNRVVDLNPAAQRAIGYTSSEAIGQRASKVLSNWPDLVERYRDVTEIRSEIVLGETEKQRYFDLHILPLRDKREHLTGRLVVLRDITKRKQAEVVLQRAHDELEQRVEERTTELVAANEQLKHEIEERKRAEEALEFTQFSVNCSADPIVWIRQDGRLIDLNEAFCRSVGYSREELLSMTVHDIDPNYPGEVWPEFWERLKAAGSLTYESYYRSKEGRVFPVEISANFLEYKDKEYHCSFVRNITSRRRGEERLRASEERYRTLVETVPDVIFSLSADGNLTSLNPAFEKITGWSRAEWIGKSFHTILHPDDLAEAVGHFLSALSGKISPIFEARVLSKSGRNITREFIGAPHIKDGKVIEVIGFAREITDRKKAEEALKTKTEELARSNKELEEFAYVASHDLQEPLRMVTSYVQLLARRYQNRLDSDADDFISFAVDGATRMHTLINGLLAYSRVGTQGKPFEPTNCEMILQQSLDNLKMTMEETGAVVTHDSLPTVMADNLQLGQLFQNLIGNAIKFHGEEPPRVHVSVRPEGNQWVFSVRDNGIGIAPEFTERIFLIFQRLHGKEKYPGTGIGLAVCNKIVECHGGRIWVESELGKGATFYFTLPRQGEQQT